MVKNIDNYPTKWRKERAEDGGWHIIGETPRTGTTVQVAWCLTEDNADYLLLKLNQKGTP